MVARLSIATTQRIASVHRRHNTDHSHCFLRPLVLRSLQA